MDGTSVAGAVGIQATVTDNESLTGVDLAVDGARVGRRTVSGTSAVTTFVWEAASALPGRTVA